MASRTIIRLAAVLGLLGVGLGAFGAHGFKPLLEQNDRIDTWETAVLYHLVHAVALLAAGALAKPSKLAVWAFAGGIILFSGPLYILSLTNATWLGAIAPLGGTALILGWAVLVRDPGGQTSRPE